MKKRGAVLENGVWRQCEIEGSLKGLQAMVGGLIEYLPLLVEGSELVTVYGNEEARLLGMEPTAKRMTDDGRIADVIAGPLIALGGEDENGDTLDLTDEGFQVLQRGMVPLSIGAGAAVHEYDLTITVTDWN